MKFLTKINRQYLLTFAVMLSITAVTGFFVLQTILKNEIRENIREKEDAIINEITSGGNLPRLFPLYETRKITKEQFIESSFKKTYIQDVADDGDTEPYMEYTNTLAIDGELYLIRIRHSLYEYDELIMLISLSFLILLVMAFLVSFLITKRLNRTLWKDFEFNLDKIRNFSFSRPETIKLKESRITEFQQLNKAVTILTTKLQHDYQSLKEFTENASHELQTPVSIISLYMEELMQQDLPEHSWKLLAKSRKTIKRMSDLNKNLLMLAKINNRQFAAGKELVMNQVIHDKLQEFSPLVQTRNLNLKMDDQEKLWVKMDKGLAGVLINNLLSNAIKHNIDGGKIEIKINSKGLTICNTGNTNTLSNETIFNRFTKENSSSFGLGLSIVREICETHQIKINYSWSNLHCFELQKSQQL